MTTSHPLGPDSGRDLLGLGPKTPVPAGSGSVASSAVVFLDEVDASLSSSCPLDDNQEKKIRREIANSNERRRMQSINAGFQSLRTLLPHHEGEKLSKAAILQQTAEYIYSLEQEKTRLLAQNCQLKRLLSLSQQQLDNSAAGTSSVAEPDGPNSGAKKSKKAKYDTVPERRAVKSKPVEQPSTLAPAPAPAPAIIVSPVVTSMVPLSPEPIKTLSSNSSNEGFVLIKSAVTDNTLSAQCNETLDTMRGIASNQTDPLKKEEQNSVTSDSTRAAIDQQKKSGSGKCTEELPKHIDHAKNKEVSSSESPYVATNASKQNLDSIVEAIKHLEGDHLFSEETSGSSQQVHKERTIGCSPEGKPPVKPVHISSQRGKNSVIVFKNCKSNE